MSTENAAEWDRSAAVQQGGADLLTEVVHYGPDIATETELRLLGDLKGKRVVELGCGGAQASIAFVKAGATAVAVDHSNAQLAYARSLCAREEVRVELRYGDMAELAFLRADTIDLVFSCYALGYVEDLGRVLRQVHRVLKVGAPFVFSLPHPAYAMVGDGAAEPLVVSRSYFDDGPLPDSSLEVDVATYHRTISELFTALVRASYRVDTVLEPPPLPAGPRSGRWRPAFALVPSTLIIRARKEGN